MTIARLIEGRDQEIIHCAPTDTVRQAAQLLAEKRIGALPVMEGGKVVGIFSERDLLYCIARDGGDTLDQPVSAVMTAPAITIDLSENALSALALMTRRRIRHLPVVDGERLVSFVSIGDLVKFRIEMVEAEARQLRDYIRTA